jgi:hypothetical protein
MLEIKKYSKTINSNNGNEKILNNNTLNNKNNKIYLPFSNENNSNDT